MADFALNSPAQLPTHLHEVDAHLLNCKPSEPRSGRLPTLVIVELTRYLESCILEANLFLLGSLASTLTSFMCGETLTLL